VAGFAGVVFALSRRETVDLPENRFRLNVLFGTALTTCVISLVPQFLWGLMSAENVWAASSTVWGLHAVFATTRAWRRATRNYAEDPELAQRVSHRFRIFSGLGMLLMILLQVANVFVWQGFHVFFLGLSFTLLLAILMFFRIVAAELTE
jgi:hypothetical protein